MIEEEERFVTYRLHAPPAPAMPRRGRGRCGPQEGEAKEILHTKLPYRIDMLLPTCSAIAGKFQTRSAIQLKAYSSLLCMATVPPNSRKLLSGLSGSQSGPRLICAAKSHASLVASPR